MSTLYHHPASGVAYDIAVEGTTFVIRKGGAVVHSGGEVVAITGQVLNSDDALRMAVSWVDHQDG